ncbi:hypothetical protein L2E82_19527 [Cichorium intybus]|uniref:Uncharacterized protein n=1 Tax=Cichorium intybus TaxID=13427 RepID=A0ACB9FCB5_CICIN|nr:hypothetical protein L2E82_19527 [Cichorium intybus]
MKDSYPEAKIQKRRNVWLQIRQFQKIISSGSCWIKLKDDFTTRTTDPCSIIAGVFKEEMEEVLGGKMTRDWECVRESVDEKLQKVAHDVDSLSKV